jgi:hypothetical protein
MVIKNLQGTGEVYEGNKKLAKVRYELSIKQEILTTEDFRGSQEGTTTSWLFLLYNL